LLQDELDLISRMLCLLEVHSCADNTRLGFKRLAWELSYTKQTSKLRTRDKGRWGSPASHQMKEAA